MISHGRRQKSAHEAISDLTARSEINARQLMLLGFAHQRPRINGRHSHVAAEQMRVVVAEHNDFPLASRPRLFLPQAHLHSAVQHLVKGHEPATRPNAGAAIFRYNLGPHTPRHAEVCFEEHSAGKAHCAQQVRERVHNK